MDALEKAKDNIKTYTKQDIERKISQENEDFKLYDDVEILDFPIDIFPDDIQHMIIDLNLYSKYNIDFTSVSIMSSISSLVGNKLTLEYDVGWLSHCNFWFCLLSNPSSKKSPVMKNITGVYKDLEKSVVPYRQLKITDFTFEAFPQIFKNNKRGVLNFQDEMRNFFDSLKRYNSNNQSRWLSLYEVVDLVINRSGKDPVVVENCCINMLGATPYEIMVDKIFGDNSGLIERFLFTNKDNSNAELRGKTPPNIFDDFYDKLKIIDDQCNYNDYNDNIFLKFNRSKKCLEIEQTFVDMKNGEDNIRIKQYLGKLETFFPKAILLLSIMNYFWSTDILFNDLSKINIKDEYVEGAFKLCLYFLNSFKCLVKDAMEKRETDNIVNNSIRKNGSNKDIIRSLFLSGKNGVEIAKVLNITPSAVNKAIKKMGLR